MNLTPIEEDLSEFIRDLGTRALHTFAQSAVGTLALLYGGSGLDVHSLLTISGLGKFYSIVIVGLVSSFISVVKSVTVSYLRTPEGKNQVAKTQRDAIAALPGVLENLTGATKTLTDVVASPSIVVNPAVSLPVIMAESAPPGATETTVTAPPVGDSGVDNPASGVDNPSTTLQDAVPTAAELMDSVSVNSNPLASLDTPAAPAETAAVPAPPTTSGV